MGFSTGLLVASVLLGWPQLDSKEMRLKNTCKLLELTRTGERRSNGLNSSSYETVRKYQCPNTGIEMIVTWER